MYKEYDIPIEQLAHDLAIIATQDFMREQHPPDNHKINLYYEEYLSEYRYFKDFIAKKRVME